MRLEPCERCDDSGEVWLASFVTPLGLAPWDEGPPTGPCPDCISSGRDHTPGERNAHENGVPRSEEIALPYSTVGRDGDAHHTAHDLDAAHDLRREATR
jgi:hypothetical protein